MDDEKKHGGSGFTAFLVGGLLGAAVALLYAPRRGEETRRILFDTSLEYKDKALSTYQDAKATAQSALADAEERLGTLSEEGKVRLGKLQEIGKSTLQEQKESLKSGLKEAKRTISEPVESETSEPRRGTSSLS
jgi:gas vesicle protein